MKNYLLLLFIPLFLYCTPQAQNPPFLTNGNELLDDMKALSSDEMEGRRTGTEGNKKAQEYLVSAFKSRGISAWGGDYRHTFSFTTRSGDEMIGTNILAKVEGKKEDLIVVSAHYDHLGIRDGEIFNGADDDASGTAALLSLASYFKENQPNHTLVFAAFDAEEMGLRGARALAEDSLFMERVAINVNMDMVSNNAANELYASGTYHHPELKPVLERIETGNVKLLFGHDRPEEGYNDWSSSSDHGAFHAKGKRFIYFGVEDHEHYHKESDEFETITPEFYIEAVITIKNAIEALDKL